MSTLTIIELVSEWRVEYAVRIGNMVGSGEPTPEQEAIAAEIADKHIAEIKAYETEKTEPHTPSQVLPTT